MQEQAAERSMTAMVNAQSQCTGSLHRAWGTGHGAQGMRHRVNAQGMGHRAQGHCTGSMHTVNAQSQCTGHGAQGMGHRAWGTGHRAQGMGHSNSAHPVEVIVDGLKEDAAQHGASLAALVPMLVDEGAEAGHGGCQVLVQVEVCRDLDCHLVSLHMQELVRLEVGGAERVGSQGLFCAMLQSLKGINVTAGSSGETITLSKAFRCNCRNAGCNRLLLSALGAQPAAEK